jgi:hypothetical protein
MGRHEVVSLILTEDQKICGQNGTDTMEAPVAGTGAAGAIAKKSRHGIGGAGGQWFTEDVEIGHAKTLSGLGESCKPEGKLGLLA